MNSIYSVTLMDCKANSADKSDAEAKFCATIEAKLGGAAAVVAAHMAYMAAFQAHEELPLPKSATEAERAAVDAWQAAESAGESAAYEGWTNLQALNGSHFELTY